MCAHWCCAGPGCFTEGPGVMQDLIYLRGSLGYLRGTEVSPVTLGQRPEPQESGMAGVPRTGRGRTDPVPSGVLRPCHALLLAMVCCKPYSSPFQHDHLRRATLGRPESGRPGAATGQAHVPRAAASGCGPWSPCNPHVTRCLPSRRFSQALVKMKTRGAVWPGKGQDLASALLGDP